MELDRLYRRAEALILEDGTIWEVDKLVTLWQLEVSWRHLDSEIGDTSDWLQHTAKLRSALDRHAAAKDQPTAALWSRTQLALMDLSDSLREKRSLAPSFHVIRMVMKEADGLLDCPADSLITIVSELGRIVSDDDGYDRLLEDVIELQARRAGNAGQGRLRLGRGIQELEAKKFYKAIDQCAKAQNLLAQDETRDDFLRALCGTALAYEGAGLLWAARANLVVGLDRTLYECVRNGDIDRRSLPLLRKLVWLDLQLGRIPWVLIWVEWLRLIASAIALDETSKEALSAEYEMMDAVLGILVLRTRQG
ncbi:MAG: hypothetical protein ACREMY_32285, partial [bacterium]